MGDGALNVVAVSGGKDSTALALRLRETEPELNPVYLITPTGDELPDMVEHWNRLECLLGAPLTVVRSGLDLNGWIEHFQSLPNWRQRWCTRLLKIRPCLDWIAQRDEPVTMLVGLRADEEGRTGIYSEQVNTRFPLREWGWGIGDVVDYLNDRKVRIPARTDCARCFYQALHEWYSLWRSHPEIYEHAAEQERRLGHTFVTEASRRRKYNSWPASLDGLRGEFERGRLPRGADTGQLELFETDAPVKCRVCSL